MKPCPVCNNFVDDDYTGLCPNPECSWDFELFGGDLSIEIQKCYNFKLQKAKSLYSSRKPSNVLNKLEQSSVQLKTISYKPKHLTQPNRNSYNEVNFFSEGMAGVRINDKWGFIDKNCNLVIPCKFNKVWSFSENLALVKLGNKFGYINKLGVQKIPCIYEDACIFKNGIARVLIDGKWKYIDISGNSITKDKLNK